MAASHTLSPVKYSGVAKPSVSVCDCVFLGDGAHDEPWLVLQELHDGAPVASLALHTPSLYWEDVVAVVAYCC